MKPIHTGGEYVFPDEVEAVLRYHPAIADAAVVGVSDRAMGERLVALVAAKPGQTPPDAEDILNFCVGRITGFKVPRTVLAVAAIEHLPNRRVDYEWARATATDRLASPAAQ